MYLTTVQWTISMGYDNYLQPEVRCGHVDDMARVSTVYSTGNTTHAMMTHVKYTASRPLPPASSSERTWPAIEGGEYL